jgi:hypothetical protein
MIPFTVTITEAWTKFVQQNGRCALTGLDLDWPDWRGMTPDGKQHYKAGSASLDRIDSAKGYTEANIQWVHKDINKMKGNLTESDFKIWCKRIARHTGSGARCRKRTRNR